MTMSQQIETEFKNLLTKEEFEQLLVDLKLQEVEPTHQTNVYYDTNDGQLRALGMGLRIRLYDDSGELTLKSPLEEHAKLETTDSLTLAEANELVTNKTIKTDGQVSAVLLSADIDVHQLKPIGQLSTIRYEVPADDGIYFLDESYYQDQKDYELEFEVEDVEKGKVIFEKFLDKYKIKPRFAAQKIERAMNYPNS